MTNTNDKPLSASSVAAWDAQPVEKFEFCDPGASGVTLVDRPALKRLIQDIRDGKLDTFVIEDMDRTCQCLATERVAQLIARDGIYHGKSTYPRSAILYIGRLVSTLRTAISRVRRMRIR
jgi:DNA invertase Pin-like site-specific DNA recombinase